MDAALRGRDQERGGADRLYLISRTAANGPLGLIYWAKNQGELRYLEQRICWSELIGISLIAWL